MDIQSEQQLIQMIAYSGNAKSLCMEAMQDTFAKEFEQADDKIQQAKKSLEEAHEFHTRLLIASAEGKKELISPILIHAQDHFMGASLTLDFAEIMIRMQREIVDLKGEIEHG